MDVWISLIEVGVEYFCAATLILVCCIMLCVEHFLLSLALPFHPLVFLLLIKLKPPFHEPKIPLFFRDNRTHKT